MEFVGLDDIIDQIIENITGWYCTREILTRPTVIPIFGPTGTGKTSILRRLTDLLEYDEKTFLFDMGELTKDSRNFAQDIMDLMGVDSDEDGSLTTGKSLDPILILDEFTNARTISSSGEEQTTPSCRPIWELLDSGIINLTDTYSSWSYNRIMNFIEDWKAFGQDEINCSIPVGESVTVTDRDGIKAILLGVGLSIYDRDIPGLTTTSGCPKLVNVEEEGEDPFRPLPLLDRSRISEIMKRLNAVTPGLGIEEFRNLMSRKNYTVGDFIKWLVGIEKKIHRPKKLNLSKSLVFVVGNLDSSFGEATGTNNADLDADTLHDITSKVNVSDVKDDLLHYFKPEQVGRLGNNYIIYPTLSKASFERIIRKEVGKVIKGLKEMCPNITIDFTKDFYDLIYSEGVSATQGVRSVQSTINLFIMPLISKVIISGESHAVIGVKVLERGFKVPEIDITINFGMGKMDTYKTHLQLGAIRDPYKRKKRYAASVHEAGHAVVLAWTRGIAPDQLVSVSVDRGGFCGTYDPSYDKEIRSKEDTESDIKISMGGYCAEMEIFGNPNKLLMGSGSDLEAAWDTFARAVYEEGFYGFAPLENERIVIRERGTYAGGFDDNKRVQQMKDDWGKWYSEVCGILKSERKLIVQLALTLGKQGSMTSAEFMDHVRNYGYKLTEGRMETVRQSLDPEYYLSFLGNEK